MGRNLRVQYPGANYHVMNRGDRRAPIFHDDLFFSALARIEEERHTRLPREPVRFD